VLAGACEPREREIILACTTSVEDSGLLDALIPAFSAAHPGYNVKVIAVGSGEALALAERGDADVVISHSPAAEQRFMAGGHGRTRTPIMANDFVLVGPSADPAGVRGQPVARALRAIARTGAPFVSRADDSGTHTRERSLWQVAGIDPAGAWFLEIGQGMGDALRVASERAGYTVSDRATFLALAHGLLLEVLVEGDEGLRNVYSVITASRGRNHEGADALAGWLAGADGQRRIAAFGLEAFGRSLFEPLSAGG
jgi:tungstate transport system substrate-binding protein